MKRKKKSLPIFLLAAMTWFGFHCGAGFASGAQVKLYAGVYGRFGFIVPFLAWTICSVFMYVVCEYARRIEAKSYKDVALSMFGKNPVIGRIVVALWDIMIVMTVITASGSCVAGCGTLMNQVLGLPYWAGCAFFVIIMLVILCFGQNILERLGKMGTILLIAFFLISFCGILKEFGTLKEAMSTSLGNPAIDGNLTKNIWNSAYTYGVTQIGSFQALVVMAGKFKKKSDTQKFAMTGFLLNTVAMLVAYAGIMAYYPDILEEPLPALAIVKTFSGGLGTTLFLAYNFVLVMAYVTTAGAMVAGSIARYTPSVNKKIKSIPLTRAMIAIILMGASALLSSLGLDGILTTINEINAICRTPVWYIPIIILGGIAIYKAEKKSKTETVRSEKIEMEN